MFLRFNLSTDVEQKWDASFQLYRSDILALHDELWHQEDVYGRSCIQYKIAQYYLAFLYMVLLHRRYTDGVVRDWDYFEELFEVEDMDKKFGCKGISLDNLLEIWEIDPDMEIPGRIIGTHCIGCDDENSNYTTAELLDLVNQGLVCTSIFTDC